MNKNTSTKTGMEIAVIGMAGKFPKAENIIEYWENLKSGKDCITFFPMTSFIYRRKKRL